MRKAHSIKLSSAIVGTLSALILLISAVTAGAVSTQFTQTITGGSLGASIMDSSEVAVVNPSVSLGSIATSATCQTQGGSGTLGSNVQRLYVNNPGAADNGWSLAIAATNGATAAWSNGSATYDFNDSGGSGCSDGGDTDNIVGRMTINPSGASMTNTCQNSCGNTGVSMGTAQSFAEGTTDAVSLVNAAANSDNVWKGYLTGITITQTIPAAQAAGAYTLDMTVTVTAS